MDENHWRTEQCAKAFWDQKEGRPYKQLVTDTIAWASPRPDETWLDLGCGSGRLSAALLAATRGSPREIACVDISSANAEPIGRLARTVPDGCRIHFHQADFSNGLSTFADHSFDGVVSGLSLSYAESKDPVTGAYTDEAFRRALVEVRRILKPRGRFVFSINVPNPNFWRILWKSLGGGLRISKPARLAVNALRMQWYGRWLRREARRGRFHYLPAHQLVGVLEDAGFSSIEHKLSYAGQAYVVRALPGAESTQPRQVA